MKRNGFTLIELMIIIAIVGIIAAMALPILAGSSTNTSIGMNGVVEERCIGGYKFVVGHRGQPTQILNEMGKGVPCQ